MDRPSNSNSDSDSDSDIKDMIRDLQTIKCQLQDIQQELKNHRDRTNEVGRQIQDVKQDFKEYQRQMVKVRENIDMINGDTQWAVDVLSKMIER